MYLRSPPHSLHSLARSLSLSLYECILPNFFT